MRHLLLIPGLLLISACTSTWQTTIPAVDTNEFNRAIHKTANQLGLTMQRGLPLHKKELKKGSYFFTYAGISAANPTSYRLEVDWKLRGDSISILTEAGTMGGDARAQARLFPYALKQQLELDAQQREPHNNPAKTMGGLMARNLVSSAWAVHYLVDKNPLISNKVAPFVYVQACMFGELPFYIALGSHIANQTQESKDMLIGFSILYGVWKLFLFFHHADLHDYNLVAASPYNLEEISREY